MDNRTIAEQLLNYAHYLEAREENLYRVQAYRRAAETILGLDRPLADVLAERGRDGLEALPGVGAHLSYTLEGLLRTGEFRTFRGAGQVDAERLLGSLPGIGPRLARRIHEELGIQTLEQLEQAAHDGRLEGLQVGPKRLRGIIDALQGRLGRRRLDQRSEEPSVAELLAMDREYRTRADRGELPILTPRRFNPEQEAWLPVFQARRGRWYFRALYSNTATAHRLGQTRDWVVIYFQDGPNAGQRTIVTETRGERRGQRVVRGREQECREEAAPAQAGLTAPELVGSAD